MEAVSDPPGLPRIRPFAPADTEACYAICLETADDGRDASGSYADPRLPGELWVGPYLRLAPEFALVLEDAEGVGGYVVGVADTAAFERRVEADWYPPLRLRYPRGSQPAGSRDAAGVDLIHRPPRMAAQILADHPAHLHIDLLPRLQARGFGRRLLRDLFSRLRAAGASGVHLGCSPTNVRAIAFYRHLGFEDLAGGTIWGRETTGP